MLHERLQYLINRHINGTLNAAENMELQEYLQGNEDSAINSVMEKMAAEGVPFYEQGQARANAIFDSIINTPQQTAPATVKRMPAQWLYAAASIILLVIVSAVYFTFTNNQPAIQQAVLVLCVQQSRRYILLPDSSRVILNQGSTLTYGSFDGNTREVHLSGEAFFDIRHNPAKPFIVYTGRIKTTVLGTAFNIKTDSSNHITVTVTRGKVKVEDGNHRLAMLVPNQQVTVDTASGQSTSEAVNAAAVTEWNRRDLKFDDTPLSEVALAIEMQFNVKVLFAEQALAESHVTATLIREEPLDEVLKVITKINGMQYAISNGQVMISLK